MSVLRSLSSVPIVAKIAKNDTVRAAEIKEKRERRAR
jgi:hypothetical protein